MDAGTATIRRAGVEALYKVPKERSRIRTIDLIDPVIACLRQQMQETYRLIRKAWPH